MLILSIMLWKQGELIFYVMLSEVCQSYEARGVNILDDATWSEHIGLFRS